MKCYYYGEPSRTLTKWAFGLKEKALWLRFPAALVIALAFLLLLPLAWLLIQAGEIGHDIAGWCGLDSRDW